MNKTKLTFALMIVAGAFAAGNFVACSSKNDSTGSAGSTGTAGGAAGTTGAAGAAGGTAGAGAAGHPMTDGGDSLPDGRCATNAYAHDGGVCMCQAATPDVCGTACTDKKTDNDNCGTCGTKCGATQACNAGACGPMPTAVLPAVTGCVALKLAVGTGGVYYADEGHGTINKVGGAAPLATGEMAPTWLATQGANLFWYNKGNKTVRMLGATGAAKTIYTNTAGPADGGAAPEVGGFVVSADGVTLYVSLGTQVLKLPVAGGASTVAVNEVHGGAPGALALNGTLNIVFPTAGNVDVDAPLLSANPAICGTPLASGDNVDMTTCPRLGRSQGQLLPDFMAVVAGRAFWVSDTQIRSELIGPMGGSYQTVASSDAGIRAAAATADAIYFASFDSSIPMSGVIQKTPLAENSTAAPLARGQVEATSVAVDATKVYWAGKDCTISSTAK